MIPTAGVADAHRHLLRALGGLTDADVGAPTTLPGWTRGHVLAHVTDAGRALADLVEHAGRGVLIPLYDPATHDRDGIIEATADRTADEHRSALREHSERLEVAWSRVADWDQPVNYRDGKLSSTVFARWREVWIHAVDVGAATPADWPGDFCEHAVDFLKERLPHDAIVTGPPRALAAWLSGRDTGDGLTGDLPELGPWPSGRPRSGDAR
ncbi:maleylpyruvate isomerase family mycothiol-dependent enzyme [Amycolatopsis sp. NBC_01307]|uniref:maleylpyruvate isomerase family mycothiol-dependent enzyme n=1 Tax=Amycolatopsis sp. NBC_01307 TaxID=2903561 RepID=UPI002E119167|nr:maleylpyruvate isomerase family mycothiol-dependent enzyme [Amycolatopsis sp. NBC_01307]